MIGFLIRAAMVAIGLWVASRTIRGVSYDSTETLIWAALMLGVVNAIVRPVLVFFTFPITLLTLGLFLLVINGLMIELVSHFLRGFVVEDLGSAILTSLIVSLTSWVISWFVGGSGYEVVVTRR
jgi:putative membrane protein